MGDKKNSREEAWKLRLEKFQDKNATISLFAFNEVISSFINEKIKQNYSNSFKQAQLLLKCQEDDITLSGIIAMWWYLILKPTTDKTENDRRSYNISTYKLNNLIKDNMKVDKMVINIVNTYRHLKGYIYPLNGFSDFIRHTSETNSLGLQNNVLKIPKETIIVSLSSTGATIDVLNLSEKNASKRDRYGSSIKLDMHKEYIGFASYRMHSVAQVVKFIDEDLGGIFHADPELYAMWTRSRSPRPLDRDSESFKMFMSSWDAYNKKTRNQSPIKVDIKEDYENVQSNPKWTKSFLMKDFKLPVISEPHPGAVAFYRNRGRKGVAVLASATKRDIPRWFYYSLKDEKTVYAPLFCLVKQIQSLEPPLRLMHCIVLQTSSKVSTIHLEKQQEFRHILTVQKIPLYFCVFAENGSKTDISIDTLDANGHNLFEEKMTNGDIGVFKINKTTLLTSKKSETSIDITMFFFM